MTCVTSGKCGKVSNDLPSRAFIVHVCTQWFGGEPLMTSRCGESDETDCHDWFRSDDFVT